LGFGTHTQTCEFVSRTTVIMHGQQASATATTAGIELDPEQAEGINTKPDSARRKSRLVIQQKSLGPLGSFALRRPC
jgi:hypothetical protein